MQAGADVQHGDNRSAMLPKGFLWTKLERAASATYSRRETVLKRHWKSRMATRDCGSDWNVRKSERAAELFDQNNPG